MDSEFDPKRLLDRYPAIRSVDVAEIEHAILGTYGARGVDVSGPSSALKMHCNFWRGAAITLSFGRNDGADVEVRYSGADYYRQHFAVSGRTAVHVDGQVLDLSPDSPGLVPPGISMRMKSPPGFENLVLRIDRTFLASKIAAMTGGAGLKDPASLPLFSCPAGAARLERLIRFLEVELEQGDAPQLFLSEMEQALAVAFVYANPQILRHELSDKLPASAIRELRLVEDYIEANWDKPLSLEMLVDAANVSARSLFYYFRKRRGKTPMQFVKEVRLRHARQMLQQSPAKTITEVALACGFGNLGHFARDYLRAWGERPSETKRSSAYRN